MFKILSTLLFLTGTNLSIYGQVNFPTGIFERSGANGVTGWITTYPETDSTVLIYMDLTRGAPSYNSGSIYTRISLTDQKIILKRMDQSFECQLEIILRGKSIIVKTLNDDCGYGNGIVSDGTFQLANTGTPQYFINGERVKVYFSKTSPEKYNEY